MPAHVHRISSRVRDDRDTPLVWDETAGLVARKLISENQKIFVGGPDKANHTRCSPTGGHFLEMRSFDGATEREIPARRANHAGQITRERITAESCCKRRNRMP
jgi:hypothetical protein